MPAAAADSTSASSPLQSARASESRSDQLPSATPRLQSVDVPTVIGYPYRPQIIGYPYRHRMSLTSSGVPDIGYPCCHRLFLTSAISAVLGIMNRPRGHRLPWKEALVTFSPTHHQPLFRSSVDISCSYYATNLSVTDTALTLLLYRSSILNGTSSSHTRIRSFPEAPQ